MTETDISAEPMIPQTDVQPDALLSRYIMSILEGSLASIRAQGGDATAQGELIRRVLLAISDVGNKFLPPAHDPEQVQWDQPDLLVGSVRSEAQYAHCLRRGYYYVPASYIQRDAPPVRWVTMCHAAYTADPGIRWYGEVLRTARVQRHVIPFPLTRNNPDEWYYAFVVRSWKPLPEAIRIRDVSVYEPRRSHLFLLTHVQTTCALFGIHSATAYRVYNALCEAFGRDGYPSFPDNVSLGSSRISDTLSLETVSDGVLLRDNAGTILARFTAKQFRDHPGQVCSSITAATEGYHENGK